MQRVPVSHHGLGRPRARRPGPWTGPSHSQLGASGHDCQAADTLKATTAEFEAAWPGSGLSRADATPNNANTGLGPAWAWCQVSGRAVSGPAGSGRLVSNLFPRCVCGDPACGTDNALRAADCGQGLSGAGLGVVAWPAACGLCAVLSTRLVSSRGGPGQGSAPGDPASCLSTCANTRRSRGSAKTRNATQRAGSVCVLSPWPGRTALSGTENSLISL